MVMKRLQHRGDQWTLQGTGQAASRHQYPAQYDRLITSGHHEHYQPPKVVVGDDYVIATLVTETSAKYRNALRIFILSLRKANYKGKIIILKAKELALSLEEEIMKNVIVKPVDVYEVSTSEHIGRNTHYLKLLTKLHLWRLHEYQHVVYYDTDMIFLQNPIPGLIRECPRDKKICAVVDEGAWTYFHKKDYMNAGFLVIRPNEEDFQYLVKNKQLAERTAFVEQDLLNLLYKNDWFRVDSVYNHMHLSVSNRITERTVAVHEKYWLVSRLYPHLLGGLQATLETVR